MIRRGINDSIECCCNNDVIQESFMDLLILSSDLYQVLRLIFFIVTAGFHFSVIHDKKVLEVSFNIDYNIKLKLVFKVIPAFII